MKNTWSEPYYGYTHLGAFSTTYPWVTVQSFGRGKADLTLWTPGCGFNPTKRTYPNTKKAKAAGKRFMNLEHRRRH